MSIESAMNGASGRQHLLPMPVRVTHDPLTGGPWMRGMSNRRTESISLPTGTHDAVLGASSFYFQALDSTYDQHPIVIVLGAA